MIFRQRISRKIVGILLVVASVLFSVKIIRCQSELVSMLTQTWTKKQVENMVGCDTCFEVGSMVMAQQAADQWGFATVKSHTLDGSYEVKLLNKNSSMHLPVDLIRPVAPFWQLLLQSRINQKKFARLIDDQVQSALKQGSPEGHGCILPANSNVVVLGDPQGNLENLRRQLVELYHKGFINAQCMLKSDSYLVFMAPGVENIEKNQDIIYVLLSIARRNEGRVFMLCNQDTAAVKTEICPERLDMQNRKSEVSLSSDPVSISKLMTLWKILPKMVLMGVQTPSTHSYDFIMLCREKDGYLQEPKKFLDDIVRGHIDSNYQQHYAVPYKAQHKKKIVPANTTSFCYTLCALIAGSKRNACNGGIIRLLKNGVKTHKPLKEGKAYPVSSCRLYTCSSSDQDQSFGIIKAGNNGHWYITSHAA